MSFYTDLEQEILIDNPFVSIAELVSDPLALPATASNVGESSLHSYVKQEVSTDPLLLVGRDDDGVEFKLHLPHEELQLKEETIVYDKPFKCGICGYKTEKGSELEKHVGLHTVDRPFKCEICNRQTTWKQCLQHYMEICTRGEPHYKCIFCEYKTSKTEILRQHLMNHSEEKCFAQKYEKSVLTDSEKRSFLCNECRIKAKNDLEKDVDVWGKTKFSCYACPFKTPWKKVLRKHLETHTVERFFRCDACSFETECKAVLRVHMRVHRQRKVLACEICGYTSNRPHRLRHHIKRYHSQDNENETET